MNGLEGKTAIVTGGSTLIGRGRRAGAARARQLGRDRGRRPAAFDVDVVYPAEVAAA